MSDGMIHTGPLAGFTVTSDPDDPMIAVLGIHLADRLGYLAASDEWTDGVEPLPDELQDAAHELVRAGLLPEFAAWLPPAVD
jgi:hypothetical protein